VRTSPQRTAVSARAIASTLAPSGLVASQVGVTIRQMTAVMDAIGAAYDAQASILTEGDVGPDVFDLRTGPAGELFQEAPQYEVRIALVPPDPAAHGPRWTELAYEDRRHDAVRIVPSRVDADARMVSEAASGG